MSIELIERRLVAEKVEEHFKVKINGKEVWINKWYETDSDFTAGDSEIFKGEELLTEEEKEEVLDFVES